MQKLSNIEKQKAKQIFDAESFKVINVYGHNAIDEIDKVIVLPYLKEKNQIILKYQNVPVYETKRPEIDKYAFVLNDNLIDEYSIKETIQKALVKNFGIQLNQNFEPEILSPIFLYPNSNVRYYICILPLMEYDYEQIVPTEDKRILMKNSNILVNINELNNIIFYELTSKYVIDIFKNHYSLF